MRPLQRVDSIMAVITAHSNAAKKIVSMADLASLEIGNRSRPMHSRVTPVADVSAIDILMAICTARNGPATEQVLPMAAFYTHHYL